MNPTSSPTKKPQKSNRPHSIHIKKPSKIWYSIFEDFAAHIEKSFQNTDRLNYEQIKGLLQYIQSNEHPICYKAFGTHFVDSCVKGVSDLEWLNILEDALDMKSHSNHNIMLSQMIVRKNKGDLANDKAFSLKAHNRDGSNVGTRSYPNRIIELLQIWKNSGDDFAILAAMLFSNDIENGHMLVFGLEEPIDADERYQN